MTPVVFGYFISALAKGLTDYRIYMFVFVILVLGAGNIFFSWINEQLSNSAFFEQECKLKKRVWIYVQNLPILVRDSYSNGVWMQKMSRDIVMVSGTCRILMQSGLGILVSFIGTFALVFWKIPSLSIIFFIVVLFAAFAHGAFYKKIESDTKELRESFYREGNTLLELLEMLPVLNSFKVTSLYDSLFSTKIKEIAQNQINQQKRMINFKTLIQLEVWIVQAVVLLVCTMLFLKNGLTIGDVVMYDMLISQMLNSLSQIMFVFPQVISGWEYAKSLNEILKTDEDFDRKPPQEQNTELNSNINSIESIENLSRVFSLDSVTFRYSSNNPAVIKNFTANIYKGETVCFLGRNGTGKSTLARLLIGDYKPESGSIYCALSKVAIVPQNIVIYNDSLLENIRLQDENIQPVIVEQMLCECGFEKFLQAQPNGIYTNLSPGALSGGELQIIGIIRALVRNSEILILDEITNNLDIVAKEAIYSILKKLKGKCTIVIITHDISCLEISDRVFVFKKDYISEICDSNAVSRKIKALETIRKEVLL